MYNERKGVVNGEKNARGEWPVDHDGGMLDWFKECNLCSDAALFKQEEIPPLKLEPLLASFKDIATRFSYWKKHEGFSGLLGFAQFTEGKYLLGVTRKEVVARVCGSEVFSVCNTIFLPFANGSEPSTSEQRYRSLFKLIDLTRGFYFRHARTCAAITPQHHNHKLPALKPQSPNILSATTTTSAARSRATWAASRSRLPPQQTPPTPAYPARLTTNSCGICTCCATSPPSAPQKLTHP